MKQIILCTVLAVLSPGFGLRVQNCIARLIRVPFQNLFNFGVSPNHAMQDILAFQLL